MSRRIDVARRRVHAGPGRKLGLLLALGMPMAVYAQVDRATVTGTVTDPSGAVVPGVQVIATSVDTNTTFKGVSNGEGFYSVLNLPVGRYNVHFDKPGFTSVDQKGLNLTVGQQLGLSVHLQVGSTAQSVTVSDDAPLLSLDPGTGTNFNSQVVTDLPLSASGGRDITSFAFAVTPTVSGNGWTTHIAGSQSHSAEVLIDGTTAEAGITGDIGEMEPSMDAVQQFQVDTSGITAEAGRTGGGAFEFSLKSGTNHLHGSAFGFLANEILDANTWMNNYFGYNRPKHRYFDYGGSAGGPIWRNKMFIFGAIERYDQSDFAQTNTAATVPTAAFLNGDFSALLGAPLTDTKGSNILDPAGNQVYAGSIFDPATGNVFQGNIIPQNRISGTSQKILDIYKKYYVPTTGTVANNYTALNNNTQPQFHQTQVSFKYDFNVTNNDRLSASYIYTLRPRINNALSSTSLWQSGSTDGGPLTQAALQTTIGNQYRVSETHTFSPNLLNVLSLTFNSFANKSTAMQAVSGSTKWPSELGFGAYDNLANFPTITFGSAVNGYGENTIGNGYVGGYVSFNEALNDTLTWVKGRHSLKFGTELRGLGVNDDVIGGHLTFNFSNETGAPLNSAIQSRIGFGFANFELGNVYSASQTTPFNTYGRRKEYAFFGEDTIKLTSKATLDLALRWDLPMPMHEVNGHWSNFDTSYQNPNFGSYTGSVTWLNQPGDSFEKYKDFKQFSPHIGFAYQVTPKIVAHAAYGLYYVPLGNNFYEAVPYGSTIGFQAVNQINSPSMANSYQFNWDTGYPGKDVLPTRDPNSTYIPWGPTSIDPHSLTMGKTQNWNLAVDYQFARDTKVSVRYIGNHGSSLHDGELNPLNYPTWDKYSALYNSGHVWDWVSDKGSAASAGVPLPYAGYAGEAYQAIEPFPQVASETYGPIFFVNSPLGTSGYNAFVVEFTKRSAHGLSLDLSYTGSRSVGNTENNFVDTWSSNYGFQDPYNYQAYASRPVSYDIPHEIKGYVDYQLPFGRSGHWMTQSKWADLLAGGWHIATVVDYQPEGAPFWAIGAQNSYPGWSSVYTDVASHPNLSRPFKAINPNWNPANGTDASSMFVSPSNFSNPADGQLGNSPLYFNNWHNWGWANEDIAAHKDFGIGRNDRFAWRSEGSFSMLSIAITGAHQI